MLWLSLLAHDRDIRLVGHLLFYLQLVKLLLINLFLFLANFLGGLVFLFDYLLFAADLAG